MNVLITGATGFVGHAVMQRLLDDGLGVHALLRSDRERAHVESVGAKVFAGDIGDPNKVAVAARGCSVVVHAAAVTHPRAAKRAHDWTNVAGTENVLNAARHVGAKRFIHISCADVTLSNENRVHWNEERTSAQPLLDSHATSKRLAEELVLPANDGSIETIALRPALIWGPGDHSTLPSLCREALSNGGLPLFGDGGNLLSSTYIDNFVDAVVLSLTAIGAEGRAYYIADEEFLEAREFFQRLSTAAQLPRPRAGLGFEISYALATFREWRNAAGAHRADVVRRARGTHFDTQHARTKLGWEPKVGIEDGMAALAAWVEKVGGPSAVAKLERPAPTAASVNAQVEEAHRAG